MTIRVVLVDDVDEVRGLVRTALRLRGGFDVVGESSDGAGAVELAERLHPDVVVLDLGLPDLAGREVLTQVRQRSPESKVVVFSGTETADRAWVAERVEGFVLKDAEVGYLVDLLAAVVVDAPRSAVLGLPQDLRAVSEARRFTRRTLDDWGLERVVEDALVVVSELVTNAIQHARSTCQLSLSAGERALRIEVLDSGAGTPDPKSPSETREHGRGLHLVSALSAAWGIDDIPDDGKLVWAELAPAR